MKTPRRPRPKQVPPELTEVEGGTRCVLTHEGMASDTMRRGTEAGWNGMLESLAGVIDA